MSASLELPANPNVHLAIPEWLTVDYFLPILQASDQKFVRIKDFRPVAATAPGENYTSIMLRIYIDLELKDGSTKRKTYILKTMLDDGAAANVLNACSLFPKEQLMYDKYLPKYTQLYEAAGLPLRLAPECLHIEQTEKRTTIVLADLSCHCFKNVDRISGFDMPHMTAALRKLAELHAASVLCFETDGPFEELFKQSFYTPANRELFKQLSENRRLQCQKAMRDWKSLPHAEDYLPLANNSMVYFDEALKHNAEDATSFNVLNHGDFWSNNIMFRYTANGDIAETLIIDFQMGQWGTPAQDLWYLITNSAALDIKTQKFDTFVRIYHERLVECLKALKYGKTIPSLKDLHCMLLKHSYWGPLTAYGVMTMLLLPTDKNANMSNIIGSGPEVDELTYKIYTNPYYERAMCQLLPFFENRGIVIRNSKNNTK